MVICALSLHGDAFSSQLAGKFVVPTASVVSGTSKHNLDNWFGGFANVSPIRGTL